MQRIYFLVPNVPSGRSIVDDLRLARIDERRIHVLAKEGTPLENLPEATLAQRSDLIPALEHGAATGGVTGALLGLAAVSFPPAGLVIGGGAVVGITLFGTGFGAWVSSMIGVRLPSRRLKQFEGAVERGQLVMMIDVPAARVEEVEEIVLRHHPEAELEGVEPAIPGFR